MTISDSLSFLLFTLYFILFTVKCFFTFEVIVDQNLNILFSAIFNIHVIFLFGLKKVISKVISCCIWTFEMTSFCTSTWE